MAGEMSLFKAFLKGDKDQIQNYYWHFSFNPLGCQTNRDLSPLSDSVILLHEKSGRTFCPKTRKTLRTFSKNLGQTSCQSNFYSAGC